MQKLQYSKKFLENINMYKQMHNEDYEKILKLIKIRQNLKIICNCTIVKDGKLTVFPLQFNDKINNYI